LLYSHPRFVQDLPKSARADPLVIRHDDTGVRVTAPLDDVAPSLAVNDKPYP